MHKRSTLKKRTAEAEKEIEMLEKEAEKEVRMEEKEVTSVEDVETVVREETRGDPNLIKLMELMNSMNEKMTEQKKQRGEDKEELKKQLESLNENSRKQNEGLSENLMKQMNEKFDKNKEETLSLIHI